MTKKKINTTIISDIITAAYDHCQRIALRDNYTAITYKNLLTYADWAKQTHITSRAPIGVHYHPSVAFGLASYTALLAGCPIVPISPNLPAPVVRSIIQTLGIKLMFSEGLDDDCGGLVTRLDAMASYRDCLHSDTGVRPLNNTHTISGTDPIYIVTTSGTTGEPKCIAVSHQAAKLSYEWREQFITYQPYDTVSVYIFPIWELFRPLLHGATVCFPKANDFSNRSHCSRFLSVYGVNEMLFTPSFLEKIVLLYADSPQEAPALDRIILNGEVVSESLLEKINLIFPKAAIWNLLSISETHDVSIQLLSSTESPAKHNSYTVGKVMPHMQVAVLDDAGNPVAPGESGELYYMSNTMLCDGYINNPKDSAARFRYITIDGQSVRVYQSGDWGSVSDDGFIFIYGRTDYMVKLRGYSIQTEPLLHTLQASFCFSKGMIKMQVIDGQQYLVFYYFATARQQSANRRKWGITGDEAVISDDYRAYLSRQIPDYCIPELWVQLQAIHIDPVSGKYNADLLPIPTLSKKRQVILLDSYTGEAKLQALWARLLNRDIQSINMTKRFEDYGGHSLLSLDLIRMIESTWDVSLSMNDIVGRTGHCIYKTIQRYSDESKASTDTQPIYYYDNGLNQWCQCNTVYQSGSILVTGSLGYIGQYLLNSLLDTIKSGVIFCLIRPGRFGTQPFYEKIKNISDQSRLVFITGDIRAEKFGLDCDTYNYLANHVQDVVHLASLVNLALPYDQLYDAVVTGSQTVIDMCRISGARLHFPSSSAVFPATGGPHPESLARHKQHNGYADTKIVVEQAIVTSSVNHIIYRLPSLSDDENPNNSDIYDIIKRHILKTGKAPDKLSFSLLNIRLVTDFMAQLIRSTESNHIINVTTNQFILFDNNSRHSVDRHIQLMPMAHWIKTLERSQPALYQLLQQNPAIVYSTALFECSLFRVLWKKYMSISPNNLDITVDQWLLRSRVTVT